MDSAAAAAYEVGTHEIWPWLSRIAGVTPPLAARLLRRLDVRRAAFPSSFWAFCGLATVPAGDGERRVAQPSRVGEETKRICHMIGASMIQANGSYARVYRREIVTLEHKRPNWNRDRRHLAAMRKMEKLFLLHLWIVWREALDLPVTEPHENDHRALGPWDMVEPPRRRWVTRPRPGATPRKLN